MEFRYYMPVKTFFGKDCIVKNSGEFPLLGKKAFIVTGKSSAEKNGSLADVKKALDNVNIPYVIYNKIEPNPEVEDMRKAAVCASESGADFIIGIGGGSPLDAAKAIAKNTPLPIAAIPTTAGTGSEMTPYSILTFDKIRNKKSISTESIFPAAAFLDPAYTETLSAEVTVNTAIDALSHAIEGYLSVRSTDVVKPYALESIKLIGECIPELEKRSFKSDTREKLLYASMLAGIVIAHAGTTAVHAMGYPLTYHKHIDHGRANGLVLYHYLKFVERESEKVKDITDIMGISGVDEFGEILDRLLGVKEMLTEQEITEFTKTAIAGKNIANTRPQPEESDIRKIFEDSFRR
ncbi:MAG: alcohol dehydrogenase [Spirochaetae bacterium HGW-Spirochaetae-5]|nr:MAG: alcohol dehydrogenase [Spirochaetae bacterium HGW-Spirochaetae-5]